LSSRNEDIKMRSTLGSSSNFNFNHTSNFNNPLNNFLKENVEGKEMFEEIITLRDYCIELEKELQEMKEQEMRSFKTKYETYKLGTTRQCVHYDLIYAALFGNHVVI
jgi:hypothetical protein